MGPSSVPTRNMLGLAALNAMHVPQERPKTDAAPVPISLSECKTTMSVHCSSLLTIVHFATRPSDDTLANEYSASSSLCCHLTYTRA
jgi:hypothetical protein